MGRFSVVCPLAFALCLVASLCASAVAGNEEAGTTEVNKETAEQAVKVAKQATTEVCQRLESSIEDLKGILENVESLKRQVEKIESQTVQSAKGNDKAEASVSKITDICTKVSSLHRNAMEELKNANASFIEWLQQAKTLNGEFDKGDLVINDSEESYKAANTKALDIKGQAEQLETDITGTSATMAKIQSAVQNMEQGLKEAKVSNLHVSAIVATTELDTMIGKADSIILDTKNKRNEVDGIVQEMQEHKIKTTGESLESINQLLQKANDALINANEAVGKVTKAKTDIDNQKGRAGAALTKFNTATEPTEAQVDVDITKACVDKVEEIILQLNSELKTVENLLTNAKIAHEKMVEALSKTTSKPSSEQITTMENADPPVGEGTGTDQKGTTIQPTSKDSPDQSNNSGENLKETLSTGAQNVPTTSLTGGRAPATGANNDSAMTVSVPLLVALIASAVLQ